MKQGKDPSYYAWVVVASLFIVGAVSFGTSLSFGVFFKSLVQAFDLTRTFTSMVFSVYIVLGSVFGVFSGWALDRYGAKVVLLLAAVFTSLSQLITSQAGAPWHLFLGFSLLLAMGVGPVYPVIMSTVSRWVSRRRMLAVGIVGSGMGIGPMLMVPLAAWLISRYDWRISYLVMGIIALVILLPCAFLQKKAPSEVVASSNAKPEAVDKVSDVIQADDGRASEFPVRQIIKGGNFWLLFAIWFFLAYCLLLVLTHLVPYLTDSGVSTEQAALILSLVSGFSVVGRLLIGKVSGAIGGKRAATACLLVMAGAMLLLLQPVRSLNALNPLGLYLFAVVFGFSNGGFEPVVVAQLADVFGLRHIGIIIGILNFGWGAGAALGSAAGGYIFDVRGSYSPAFITVTLVLLVTAGLAFLLKMPVSGWEKRRITTSV